MIEFDSERGNSPGTFQPGIKVKCIKPIPSWPIFKEGEIYVTSIDCKYDTTAWVTVGKHTLINCKTIYRCFELADDDDVAKAIKKLDKLEKTGWGFDE